MPPKTDNPAPAGLTRSAVHKALPPEQPLQMMVNGVVVGGPSISGADKGYDKGATEAQGHEGCRIKGTFSVQRVPGNFHFSSHAYAGKFMRSMTMRQLFPPGMFPELSSSAEYDLTKANMSHTINHLAFGEHSLLLHHEGRLQKTLESIRSGGPAEMADRTAFSALGGNRGGEGELLEYYITAVPTLLKELGGGIGKSFQYTAHHHTKPSRESR